MKILNKHGLSIHFQDDGSVKSIEVDPIRISMKNATLFGYSGANIFLRKRSETIEFKALTGAGSNSAFAIKENRFTAKGIWEGIEYVCELQLSEHSHSWQWKIETTNRNSLSVELDLIMVQDIGLKQIQDGLVNEYYVSQYIERRILEDPIYGKVICCRQNMKEASGNPWMMLACKNGAASALTDGMLFYGKTFRETFIPEALISESLNGEYAGESSLVALQEQPFGLESNESHCSVFICKFLHDHPLATSNTDLSLLPELINEFNEVGSIYYSQGLKNPVSSIFTSSGLLSGEDLTNEELETFFGTDYRHAEYKDGKLLSFFYEENNHVAFRLKEILCDRPHGHIIQAKSGYEPDESIVSTTSFAFGAFNSHLTQGNTNFNTLLSVCSSQFNQDPETGQRIFLELNGKYYLLGVPSAFETGLNHCRWIYKYKDSVFQVRTWTSKTAPQVNLDFKVLKGESVKLLITNQFDRVINWTALSGDAAHEFICKPSQKSLISEKFPDAQFRIRINGSSDYHVAGDEILYSDHLSRCASFFVLDIEKAREFSMSFLGEIEKKAEFEKFEDADAQFVKDKNKALEIWKNLSQNLSLQSSHHDISAINEILPWFGMNALIHYLTPYGLEQFSGAAWGTRDVAQGPTDLLLSMGKYSETKKILCIIFSNQNPDGGWPQWWMFDRYKNIRSDHAHGDIIYWCIIALSRYIKITGDRNILDEVLPYYHNDGEGNKEQTPLYEHVDRLINMITDSFIPDTYFVPFGGGDWNDSLQPVSQELADRMISSWTVEMNYQAFNEYAEVCDMAGRKKDARRLRKICRNIKTEFNRFLIKDSVVAGYGLIGKNGRISLLLHPSDRVTGIKYSILPMNRGIISGLFTKKQAEYHQQIIEKHLKGPDGARLMERPLKYRGGIQNIFQRAESSVFFGREIGLMYMHEHVRYAESLAVTGKADEFIKALRQVIPIEYSEVVPCGDLRQSNCYYSSSDVAFSNRYEADKLYKKIAKCRVTLKGGWRVYSSGPGIYTGLIIQHLLGLRIESERIIFDPVMPLAMDGLMASFVLLGKKVRIVYRVRNRCYSPKKIIVNGNELQFLREKNEYREGGSVIGRTYLLGFLDKNENMIEINM